MSLWQPFYSLLVVTMSPPALEHGSAGEVSVVIEPDLEKCYSDLIVVDIEPSDSSKNGKFSFKVCGIKNIPNLWYIIVFLQIFLVKKYWMDIKPSDSPKNGRFSCKLFEINKIPNSWFIFVFLQIILVKKYWMDIEESYIPKTGKLFLNHLK